MKIITGNKQFDFQINRFITPFLDKNEVREDLKEIPRKITDFNSWFNWWSKKAKVYEQKAENEIAASYYKAAMFYLKKDNPNKKDMYDGFIRNFYKSYNDFDYERGNVPYENSYLPTLLLKNKNAKRTLLVIGGFDGYLEEIAEFFGFMKDTDYNILIFDGPGQGNTFSNGLVFTPYFEKPVSKVLDYYSLNEVDAIGLSWGGYLVMRSAAFEKRINKVIAMDIFYTPMDTLKMNLGAVKYICLKGLLNFKAKRTVNHLISSIGKKDVDMKWKLNNGYQLTGEQNPYDLINNLRRHNAKNILSLVNQDCLLLAGKEDQYVPYKRLYSIKKELVNSSFVKTKLFTKETGGEQHCQLGRMDLAFDEIKKFLLIENN